MTTASPAHADSVTQVSVPRFAAGLSPCGHGNCTFRSITLMWSSIGDRGLPRCTWASSVLLSAFGLSTNYPLLPLGGGVEY